MISIKKDKDLWNKSVKEALETYNGVRSAWMYAHASKLYKEAGGTYSGSKKSNSLTKWIEADWTTKSGKPALETGERYLPKKVIEKLTPKEYNLTSLKKRIDLKKGIKNSKQPKKIASKVSNLIDKYNLT